MKLNPPMPDYRTFKRVIVGAVMAMILLIIGFSTWKSVGEYRLTIRAAEQKSRGYARALKEHAERTFSEADNVLLDTIDHIKDHGGIDRENSRHLREFLFRHPRNVPQVGSIILVNRDGLLFAHSLETPVKQADVADREYFIHHRDNPADDTPFLSKPVQSRINGKWRFTLSRPVRSDSGVFEGLVAVAFEMEYFQDFYRSLDLGKKGRIVIVRKDGALILTEPYRDHDYSVDFSKSYLFLTHLPRSPRGTFQIKGGKALLEKTPRIISYEALDNFPLVANANMGTDEVTAAWRDTTYKQAVITAAACLALILLTIALLRQIRRIEQAYLLQTEHQAEIAAAEERYRLLVDNLPVVVWRSDENGVTSFISRNIEKIYGYTPEEIYAAGNALWFDRIHGEDKEKVVAAFRSLFGGVGIYDVEYRIQRKDGTWIWISDFAYTTTLQDGVLQAHGVFSDVSDRKQVEDTRDQLEIQLLQAQKMEAIGHLAGGIAHDFNNLLTPIMGYAEMVVGRMETGDPLISKMAGIIAAAHRAKDLTGQLLNFGRRSSMIPEVIDLNEVIRSFHGILRRTIRENISIDLMLDPEGAFIRADKSQVGQIILNLTVNAQDAFSDQGRIVVETCKVQMDAKDVHLHPGMLPGEYVRFTFQDNGCGMTSDVQNHIFEPFFTTKQVGHGTGLGLATIYGIVRQHDAHISVASREGAGTTFRIYFPGCHPPPPTQKQPEFIGLVRDGGTATIMLAEDNEMVREMVREMLHTAGFTVHAVSGPQAALELLAGHITPVDLLISDVVMPDMSGPELYELLVAQLPGLKVMYISGYPIRPGMRGGTPEEALRYLQKPFTAEALLERVIQVLSVP
ncbi:MAG: PAS domain-containing protein [Geobacteraceae bacterium]|nr:PAS domain-containing protein [Geobacteraceae bacterium]